MRLLHWPMRSTNIHCRIAWQHDEESLDVVESICISTDLLEQLFSELRSLAIDHPEFARALSSRGSDVRARLWTLHEIVGLLRCGDDSTMVAQLTRRATALISW